MNPVKASMKILKARLKLKIKKNQLPISLKTQETKCT